MDISEVKQLIEFAIEKKVAVMKWKDLSFQMDPQAFNESIKPVEEMTEEELKAEHASYETMIERRKRAHLDALFNHK